MNTHRPDISQRLAKILGPGTVVAYFQPKLGLDMSVAGMEALARWHGVDNQVLLPGNFLPICNAIGLEQELTIEMISQAIAAAATWQKRLGRAMSVSVNLTSRCVNSPQVLEHLIRAAHRHHLPHKQVTVEILEDALDQPTDFFLFALNKFRHAGFRVSIDDFGTGAAGLQRLIDFKADEVKIAGYFAQGVSKDVRKATLIEAIVALADAFGMQVVIEGIEDPYDLSWCQKINSNVVSLQGFHLARPLPLPHFPTRTPMAA